MHIRLNSERVRVATAYRRYRGSSISAAAAGRIRHRARRRRATDTLGSADKLTELKFQLIMPGARPGLDAATAQSESGSTPVA